MWRRAALAVLLICILPHSEVVGLQPDVPPREEFLAQVDTDTTFGSDIADVVDSIDKPSLVICPILKEIICASDNNDIGGIAMEDSRGGGGIRCIEAGGKVEDTRVLRKQYLSNALLKVPMNAKLMQFNNWVSVWGAKVDLLEEVHPHSGRMAYIGETVCNGYFPSLITNFQVGSDLGFHFHPGSLLIASLSQLVLEYPSRHPSEYSSDYSGPQSFSFARGALAILAVLLFLLGYKLCGYSVDAGSYSPTISVIWAACAFVVALLMVWLLLFRVLPPFPPF